MRLQRAPWGLHPYYIDRIKNAARNLPDYKAGKPGELFRDIVKLWCEKNKELCKFPEKECDNGS